jgi:ABC-type branched-subunit amino acid transport system substrate-binding protein
MPSRSPLRRTRPIRRGVALAAVVTASALLLSACGASSSSDEAAADVSAPGPGVTADSVKIGFVTPNKATSAGGGGFTVADQGDAKAQVAAVVDYVNANGGFGGRTIEPVIRTFESSTDSPQTESALCNAFTRDDQVFAVVMVAQRLPVARECYRKANTVMVDIGGTSLSQATFDANKPYLWSLTTPAFDSSLKALVPNLKARGFFAEGAKVGVLAEKAPEFQQLVDDVLKPAVAAAGSEVSVVATIDQSTADNAASTSRSAVATLKDADVTHLLFVGRPDNSGYYTGTAFPQKYFPRLAITTFEDPNFLVSNPAFSPPETLAKSIGIGAAPSTDGVRDTYELPQTDAQRTCIEDVYGPKGITFESVAHARNGLRYCDSVMFLNAVGEKLGEGDVVNATTFADAAYALGDTWQAAYSLRTRFAEGVHAPSDGYRELTYEDGAYLYGDDLRSLTQG